MSIFEGGSEIRRMKRLEDLDRREIHSGSSLDKEIRIRREIIKRKAEIRAQNDAREALAKMDVVEKDVAEKDRQTQAIIDERLKEEDKLESIVHDTEYFDSAVMTPAFQSICAHLAQLRELEARLQGEKYQELVRLEQDISLFITNIKRQPQLSTAEKDLIKQTEVDLRDWIYNTQKEQARLLHRREIGKTRIQFRN